MKKGLDLRRIVHEMIGYDAGVHGKRLFISLFVSDEEE
jgi:hypothetical protein